MIDSDFPTLQTYYDNGYFIYVVNIDTNAIDFYYKEIKPLKFNLGALTISSFKYSMLLSN